MSTAQLLELFRVDKQLRGLRGRLDAAERFLSHQLALLAESDREHSTCEAAFKIARATAHNEEGEALRLESRMEALREQMNKTSNPKQYAAIQSEVASFKEQKSAAETRGLEALAKAEKHQAKLTELATRHAEREQITATARKDRDAKNAEIKERVDELGAQRSKLTQGLSKNLLDEFERLVAARGDEAMAPVEILDRRASECTCTACMMAVPVEITSRVMRGEIVSCPSCRCFLFMDEATKAEPAKAPAKPAPRKKKVAATAESE